ncbi:hypothetical protein [Aerococcus kribbianus]|uniref:Uncharacterized protein n=1 Tax=Aerococcus kribbianus TaxID=2999064 RepID=A0A9X3FN20_9LACT|nr:MULTISPECIES: hypothetical protein [unclassified Aerococcus]MCZ0717445.1 hypothetical protein [Aerococcus sp. YH-aer221]MCZ0725733.1 hypothetical protein [Aerococcus sp. YH-aer222]
MTTQIIVLIVSGAFCLVGGFLLAYTIYQLTLIDAQARGLAHPKLWGVLNAGSNNGNGFIIPYLIHRNKYPIQNLSKQQKQEMMNYKKKAYTALAFHLVAGIIFIISFIIWLGV